MHRLNKKSILYLLSDVDGLTEEKAEKLVKKLFLAISHCAIKSNN